MEVNILRVIVRHRHTSLHKTGRSPAVCWLGQAAWEELRHFLQEGAADLPHRADWETLLSSPTVPTNALLLGMRLQSSETADDHISVHGPED